MIVEVDMENGFWYGCPKMFWSKDQDGNIVSLSKKEYEQMMVNAEVLVLDE